MESAGTASAAGSRTKFFGNQARMLLAAAVGLPCVARAFQMLDLMPAGHASYWMMAPLFFTVWVVTCAGRNAWLEAGGWAALGIACFYVLESHLAVGLQP